MKIIRFVFAPYIWLLKHLLISGFEYMLVFAGWKTLDEALEEFEYFSHKKCNLIDLYVELYLRNAPSTKDYFD